MKNHLLWLSVAAGIAAWGAADAAEQVNLSSSPNNFKLSLSKNQAKANALVSALKLSSDYQFVEQKSIVDIKGNHHVRFKQTYLGVPVWAQSVTTHNNAKSNKQHLSGQLIQNIEKDLGKNVTPKLSKANVLSQVKKLASENFGKLSHFTRENAELVIVFNELNKKAELAYHVEIMATGPNNNLIRHMYLVDATDGLVSKNWNALMHFDVTGPGGNEKTEQYEFGTDYPALNGTDDGAGGTCYLENENVRAVNLDHTTDTTNNTAFEFPCSENTFKEINGAYSPINDAFFFGNVAFDLYREWYDSAPLPFQLSMKVHYGSSHENAYWTGQAMLFGDGATTFYPLVDINVAVHEVSHGFTDFNSDLIYSSESGGMNEAFSDIAGEAGEYFWRGEVDWFVGKDIMKNGDGLRFFEDPTQDGRSIGHYDDYVEGMDVHFSSGLFNRAYFLLSNKDGWDPRKAFDTFVLANQAYWTADSTFSAGACGVIMAALDLEYSWYDVYDAMAQVGVECTGNTIDEDNDGMSDIQEWVLGFDTTIDDGSLDFDGDGILNRVELRKGWNPKDRDSDNDGLADGDELLIYGTDVMDDDSDNDGMPDGYEISNGFDPLNSKDADQDSDEDGIPNLMEYMDNTSPTDSSDFTLPSVVTKVSFEDGMLTSDMGVLPGYPLFTVENDFASDGMYSMKSPEIGGGFAVVAWPINVEEDGTLDFDLKVATGSSSIQFQLYLDGSRIYYSTADFDWSPVSFAVTAGAHDVWFVYYKGAIGADDAAWVDNIVYPGLSNDVDGDDMLDLFETKYGLDPTDAADAALDLDDDTLTNLEEYTSGSNPTLVDSDGDTLNDADEVNTHGTNPAKVDSDSDGINDNSEVDLGLDPNDAADGEADLDDDGFSNRLETEQGTDLNSASSTPNLSTIWVASSSELDSQWSAVSGVFKTWGVETDSSGASVIMAEPIANNTDASIEYTDVFEEGVFSFTLNGDTETDYDIVKVMLDGDLHSSYSGAITDQVVSINVPQGEHTITLVYSKNEFSSAVGDRVSVKNAMFMSPDVDSDNDGLSNAEEVNTYGTDPLDRDSDDDGVSDGEEISRGMNPLNKDSDGDGIEDGKDYYPNNANRWKKSDGGSLAYIFLFAAFAGFRRRYK